MQEIYNLFTTSPVGFWIVFILVALVIEWLTVSLVSIWFVLGGIVALIALGCGLSFAWQVLLMFVVSLISFAIAWSYPPLRRQLRVPVRKTNADALVGENALVLTPVSADTSLERGKVKVKGQVWSAVATEVGCVLNVGETAEVVAIKGVCLYVKPQR